MDNFESVLIVDDDDVAKFVCERILKSNFGVQTILKASNGYQALNILEELPAQPRLDLIILDLHMPGMDGFQLAEQIQKRYDSDAKVVRLVLLTSSQDPDDIAKARRLGILYLQKPVTVEALAGLTLASNGK
jgi:CheY-like chemotaxis protein